MGFYTNITISNDFWHQIAEDPQALVKYVSYKKTKAKDAGRKDSQSSE